MTITGILAFVLKTGLGTRELSRRLFTLPLAIVAVVGAPYLRSVPTSAGAIELITIPGVTGAILGLVAGALMKVRRTDDGRPRDRGRQRGLAPGSHRPPAQQSTVGFRTP